MSDVREQIEQNELVIQIRDLLRNLMSVLIDQGVNEIREPLREGVKEVGPLVRDILKEFRFDELVGDLDPVIQSLTEVLSVVLGPMFDVVFTPVEPDPENPEAAVQAILMSGIRSTIVLGIIAILPELAHPLKNMGLGRLTPAIVEMGGFNTIASSIASTFTERTAIAPLRYALNSKFTPYKPNVQDVIRLNARLDLGIEWLTDNLAQNGYNAEWALKFWDAHWELISITQSYQMFHKGLIDEKTLERLLIKHDFNPADTFTVEGETFNWPDLLKQNAYNIIPKVDIRYAFEDGLISAEDIYDLMLKEGFSPHDAEMETKIQINRALSAERDDLRRQYQQDFERGWFSQDELTARLTELGYNADKIAFYVAKSEVTRARDLRDEKQKVMIEAYRKYVYTEETLRAELVNLGMVPEYVEELIKYEVLRRARVEKTEP